MNPTANRPVLIDFFALSGTGKSTHSKALVDHLAAQGFRVKTLSFTVRRNGKNGSFTRLSRQPLSTFFKSVHMGRFFYKLSSKKTGFTEIFSLIKWSHRLLTYDHQIRSYGAEGLDYVILDPSLSSKLKKFYKHFDDDSFVEVVSFLDKNNLTSDIVVILEADMDIVKERRLGRGSEAEVGGDAATFSVKKAFAEVEKHSTSTNYITVGYNCFSHLEGNVQKITELCIRLKS